MYPTFCFYSRCYIRVLKTDQIHAKYPFCLDDHNLLKKGTIYGTSDENMVDHVILTEDMVSKEVIRRMKKKYPRAKIHIFFVEPMSICNYIPGYYSFYANVIQCESMVHGIYYHDMKFIKEHSNAKYIPYGTSWIDKKDRKLWKKGTAKSLISMISSSKFSTPYHKIRHTTFRLISRKLKNRVDLYGRGWEGIVELENKLHGLAPYFFTIVIENGTDEGYFSEKLIDALLTRTIPLYIGSKTTVLKYFDMNGILLFETAKDIIDWIYEHDDSSLRKIYAEKKTSVESNFLVADKWFDDVEKYLFDMIFNN